jgi:hypothetical protein
MRITNNGHFDLHVEFKLKSSMPPEEGEGGGGKKDAKKASKDTIDNTSIFLLDPPEMDIPVDETQELFIYAFPNVRPTSLRIRPTQTRICRSMQSEVVVAEVSEFLENI